MSVKLQGSFLPYLFTSEFRKGDIASPDKESKKSEETEERKVVEQESKTGEEWYVEFQMKLGVRSRGYDRELLRNSMWIMAGQ